MKPILNINSNYFPLIFVVKFIISIKKSGKLYLSEKSSLSGEITFKEGNLISSAYHPLKGIEAIQYLFNSNDSFKFVETDISCDESSEKLPSTEDIFSQWHFIKDCLEVIPLNEVNFAIIPLGLKDLKEEPVFSKADWVIISHIPECKSFIQLLARVKLTKLETTRILLNLYKEGYIKFYNIDEQDDSNKIEMFNGDLSKFSFKDILSLIYDSNINGILKVISDNNHAEIYIEKRKILDAKCNLWSGDMAVAEMINWKEGNFFFYKFIRKDKYDSVVTLSPEEIISGSSEKIFSLQKTASYLGNIMNVNKNISDGDYEKLLVRKDLLVPPGDTNYSSNLNELTVPLHNLTDHVYKYVENKDKKYEDINLPPGNSKEERESIKETILSQADADSDLLSLLKDGKEERESIKETILSQADTDSDLLSLLKDKKEDRESIKKAILSQADTDSDLLSLLKDEKEDRESIRKAILSQTDPYQSGSN
jgi:hypothetical protein